MNLDEKIENEDEGNYVFYWWFMNI
jgi:hypothetical protein